MSDLPLLTMLAAQLTYLVGEIPFGVVVGRLKGVDVRKAGSGNIGAPEVRMLVGGDGGLPSSCWTCSRDLLRPRSSGRLWKLPTAKLAALGGSA